MNQMMIMIFYIHGVYSLDLLSDSFETRYKGGSSGTAGAYGTSFWHIMCDVYYLRLLK